MDLTKVLLITMEERITTALLMMLIMMLIIIKVKVLKPRKTVAVKLIMMHKHNKHRMKNNKLKNKGKKMIANNKDKVDKKRVNKASTTRRKEIKKVIKKEIRKEIKKKKKSKTRILKTLITLLPNTTGYIN